MKGKMTVEFIIVIAAVFLLSVLLLKRIIPILKSKKMGQKILDIGPRWHKSKEGTPTMGGIAFIIAILVVLSAMSIYYFVAGNSQKLIPLALAIGLATINGLIGIIDDRCKLLKKKNEGLKFYEKLVLQTVAAAVYLFAMYRTGYIDTSVHIPFTAIELELGLLYYVAALVLIVGVVNGVNLTDGLDGLASGVTLIVGIFFALCAFFYEFEALSLASASLIGAMLGFLVYNFNPARIFMGDTGSLFLGGMVTGCAFMINDPLVILICGIIYVVEIISDIIQMGCYKLTKKRVFKMAPIHHHFEKCGWSEKKIFTVFCIVTLIGCILAWLSL